MWRFVSVVNLAAAQLWFSDGGLVHAPRGGANSSHRLIVHGQGFLDVTEVCGNSIGLDFNHRSISTRTACGADSNVDLELVLLGHGAFSVSTPHAPHVGTLSGHLKALPVISHNDIAVIDEMISKKVIPYQNIPDAPGKSVEEIRLLGQQYFPFSPYSFQLAVCIYDWTTASFTRLEFMKIFQYTSLPKKPVDTESVAEMIWASNFGPYTPQSPDFMNSFLMTPASSLAEVQNQLNIVGKNLRRLSDAENNILSAAYAAMPRTPVLAKPRLYSGQVDIFQLGVEHFGIEFLQCPLNHGPVGKTLITPFASALETFIAPGRVITTKMVWAYTDSFDDALHYANGIVLVVDPPDDGAWVWDAANYVTPISDDAAKTEYDFAPGTSFRVLASEMVTVNVPDGMGGSTTEKLTMIHLQLLSTRAESNSSTRSTNQLNPISTAEVMKLAAGYSARWEQRVQVDPDTGSKRSVKLAHKDGGRRCRCYDAAERITFAQ